jgi:cytochrome c
VDPHTGNLFFGEVGPDAARDDAAKGPQAYEEINTVTYGGGGNYGWPRCMGPKLPYGDYDWAKGVSRGSLDCSKTVAPSIYYTGSDGFDWAPLVGAGTKTSEALVYYPCNKGSLALPARFHEGIVLADWQRGYAYGVPVSKGQLVTDTSQWSVIRPPIPTTVFVGVGRGGVVPKAANTLATMIAPLDGAVGRDGAVYLVEYGTGYGNNPLSRLSRLVGGVRPPNPSRDFIHTPGVPVVSAKDAFNPAPVAAVRPTKATKHLVTTPTVAAGSLLALALGVGLWRRRSVPAA